jgi:hypothetical protein
MCMWSDVFLLFSMSKAIEKALCKRYFETL